MAAVVSWGAVAVLLGVCVLVRTESQFSQCLQSFYRDRPPAGFRGEERCHRLLDGQAYATVYHKACEHTVLTALCIGKECHRGGRGETQEEGEEEDKFHTEDPQDVPVLPGTLLNEDKAPPDPRSPTWDSLVYKFIQNDAFPKCRSVSGALYVLAGRGHVHECKRSPLWLAMCCSSPNEVDTFSVGVAKQAEEEEDGMEVLDVGTLGKLVGTDDLFPGGCVEGQVPPSQLQEMAEGLGEGPSESIDLSESGSTFVDILCVFLSLVSVPFRPVIATLGQIPFQAFYVIQEDVGVLSSLPCSVFSVFYNILSDTACVTTCAGGLLGKAGALCGSYICSTVLPLLETLMHSCCDGVTGVGSLALDGVGMIEGAVTKLWWVVRVVGRRTWEEGEGFSGAVVAELGSQVQMAWTGLGQLGTTGGHKVSNVVKVVGWVVQGGVDMVLGTVMEAFGREV